MSIGEALAQARHDAGLSISDVSGRTRIRLSVIDDVEHDNYAACGGDYRTRDTITAIARAVGVDPEPLIEAYDAARQPGDWIIARASDPLRPAQAPEALMPSEDVPEPVTAHDEPEPATAYDRSEPVTAHQVPELATASEDTEPIPVSESTPAPDEPPDQVTSAGPAIPAWTTISTRTSRPSRPVLTGQRPVIWIALGAALLAVIVLGGILLIMGASGQPNRLATAAGSHHHRGSDATHPARTSSARPSKSTRPTSSPRGEPGQALAPASIAAFGPGGAGQGDSPQLAGQALADKAAAPWHSAWYTTANFGNLQSGTGLLLDMGRPVTIISARMTLGHLPGADVTLRIGNRPTLSSLSAVARANDAAGVVKLKTTPATGRYVLVWFTKLPPDQAGTFEVSVYDIKLRGHR